LQKLGCPVWQCETSANRSDFHSYNAVLFHLRTWSKNDLPPLRLSNQRYVFWSMESAAWRTFSVAPMAEFFNWTMTYRWDSDVIAPYGYIRPIGNVPLHPNEAQMKFYLYNNRKSSRNYAKGKTKMAVWFASNCWTVESSRNELVKELQKYIAIDVYGNCGNLTCPKKQDDSYESSEECRELAASEYKFYLSLENSLCRDYVTEKYTIKIRNNFYNSSFWYFLRFFAMMHHPIIPVVYGLHDDHEKLSPPHSFINVAKFENTKELANYLILLNNNDTLYNEYFWWKPYFKVHDSENDRKKSMCRLCAALQNDILPRKIYHNLTDWWDTQSLCIFSPEIF
jgi:alpha-1,3-fucosyltransferase